MDGFAVRDTRKGNFYDPHSHPRITPFSSTRRQELPFTKMQGLINLLT
jgi:hypothetical protein